MNEPVKYPMNTWEQVGPGGVYVTYRAGGRGSACGSQVVGVGFNTDPTASWYDYGKKSFPGKLAESLPKAKAWAEQHYGIKRWRRNSAGDYVDADKKYLPLQRDVERRKAKP